jgi:DNA repair protein RadD
MVLGIGFNVPHVEMICLLRPTASGGLFVQQVGRGLRNAPGKDSCLVLDFADNTVRHGPIDMVRGKTKSAATQSDAAKVKVCPTCQSLVPHGVMTCPDCGFVFPPAERQMPRATANAKTEIVSVSLWHDVDRVTYQRHIKYGALDAPHTFRVNYICGYTTYSEWLCFDHLGYAREKALYWWRKRSTADLPEPRTVTEALERAHNGELAFPMRVLVQPDGKFFRITKVDFDYNSMSVA